MRESKRRLITLIVHKDGDLSSRTYRVPLVWTRAAAISGTAVALLIVSGAVLYGPIVRTAARVPGLQRQITELRAENEQVRSLAARLEQVEASYEQVRGMLGGNILPRRSTMGEGLVRAFPIMARDPDTLSVYETGVSLPTHWPLDQQGIVTRGPIGANADGESHPGLDIAVPTGTPIRAAGGGVVAEAGIHPEYGRFVLINHPDGYQSMYGHASRVLVKSGETVRAGQVIALSGSTGRSTAPHLHFETRRNGQPVDPRSLLSRQS